MKEGNVYFNNSRTIMKEPRDFVQMLREERSDLKRKDLFGKLAKLIDYLWTHKLEVYKTIHKESAYVEEVKRRLLEGHFPFSEMHRSLIPKPNKPTKKMLTG
jgi:hypothetical protein